MKFEHTFENGVSSGYVQSTLDRMSEDGWELVAATNVNDTYQLFFKRPA